MPMRVAGIVHPVIDCDRSLREMINLLGPAKKVNPKITEENFPVLGRGKEEVEIFLLVPLLDLTTGQVFREIRGRGYRPVRIEELLSFEDFIRAKGFLNLEDFTFIALGSSCPTTRSYPALYPDSKRGGIVLELFPPSEFWTQRDCFPVLGRN